MDIDSLYALYQRYPEICTDTRKITPGCIFFALKGANFDGTTFASEALNQGAAYAVVSDPSLTGQQFIHAHDTLHTLQSLAHTHRRQLSIPLIAITGTNGKTTTKELVAKVLSEKYSVHATKGNLNNHIGVPLTLLATPLNTEIIVCEMGANHIGEIERLCEIAIPTHGIITNIGKAHLEGFGSIEGIQKAKGELFDYLRLHQGVAFINTDDPRLNNIGKDLSGAITYGFNASSAPLVHFKYMHGNDGGFTIEDIESKQQIHSQMFGFYNASNVLAAYTIGLHFNVPQEKMVKSLSSFIPGANRSEVILHKGCRIIKDAYNANPTSLTLALQAFAQRFPEGWIVLGDMKELGEESENAHQQIIGLIAELGLKYVILVGKAFKSALENRPIKFSSLVTADDIDEVRAGWSWEKYQDQTLLLKGSRSMNLEKLLEP